MEGPSVRRHWTWTVCPIYPLPLKKLVRAGLSHRSFDALWEKDLLPRGYRRLPRGADGPPATHYYELELGHRGAGSDLLYAVGLLRVLARRRLASPSLLDASSSARSAMDKVRDGHSVCVIGCVYRTPHIVCNI